MFERSEFCTVGIAYHLLFLVLSRLERLADRSRKEKRAREKLHKSHPHRDLILYIPIWRNTFSVIAFTRSSPAACAASTDAAGSTACTTAGASGMQLPMKFILV